MLQIQGKGKFRAQPNALLLTAGLVWFINGIHSRPLEGRSCRELVRAILPHTDDPPNHFLGEQHVSADSDSSSDSTDEETAPWAPSGVLFFRDFLLPPDCTVPRMRQGRSISNKAIMFFFSKDYRSIQHMLDPVGIVSKDDIPDTRIPTRKGMTAHWCGDDAPGRFNLAADGYTLPPEIDAGDDVEEADALDDNPEETLDRKLTTIWHQILIDIIQKAPNPKEGVVLPNQGGRLLHHRGCLLSEPCPVRRLAHVPIQNGTSRLMEEYIHAVMTSQRSCPCLLQHKKYSTCRYYLDWKRFMSDMPTNVRVAVRNAIREKFDAVLDSSCHL